MYTRNNTIQLIVISFALLLQTGCKKFLDANPDNSVAVPVTLEQVQALLDNANKMNLNCTPNLGESSTDDFFLLDATYNGFSESNRNIYIWSVKDYFFSNDWSKAYEPVYISNYSLEALAKITVTAKNMQQWNNAKGSALFFRSYHFLNLLWLYAKAYDVATAANDLGIVLRLQSDFNIPSVRSNVNDCYNRVIQDTKTAIPLLPDHPVHVMRPSKKAAYGLLARAYLSMRIYDSALVYAEKSLALQNSLINFNSDPDIPNGVNASVTFKKFNKETVFYSEMGTTFFINAIQRAKIDTNLTAAYSNTDLRKKAFLKPLGNYHEFKGSFTGNNNLYFTGITTAEMLLTQCECLARKNQLTPSLNLLNQFLQTRWDNAVPFIPVTASTAAEALSVILMERRKELYMRGLRWMDIKRLNKEGANIILLRKIAGQTYTLQPNAGYYAFPIPSDIIQITGIPQN